MGSTLLRDRRGNTPPLYTYMVVPGVPSISVLRFLGPDLPAGEPLPDHAHMHDFLVLAYFERGGGSMRLGSRIWQLAAGDAYIIAPGEVVGVGDDADGLRDAAGWAIFFPAEVLRPETADAFLSWRTHPLLFPFVRGSGSRGAQRLSVAPAERAAWSHRITALDTELRGRRDGYREAVMAHLTLLLVEVARLAVDVVGDLRLTNETLLADVFGIIEARYHERLSLADVARALGLTPGYLTTEVRRKTGRTVGAWIVERRMAAARRLLVETNVAVEEVARTVGYGDAGYFVRHFRRAHGTTPLAWRRAGRP